MNSQQVLDFTNKTEVRTTCHKGLGHCYQVLSTACGTEGGDIGATITPVDGMFELRGEHYHSLEDACRANARMCRRLFY